MADWSFPDRKGAIAPKGEFGRRRDSAERLWAIETIPMG